MKTTELVRDLMRLAQEEGCGSAAALVDYELATRVDAARREVWVALCPGCDQRIADSHGNMDVWCSLTKGEPQFSTCPRLEEGS